jgi:hypothetical protein
MIKPRSAGLYTLLKAAIHLSTLHRLDPAFVI